MIYTSYFAKLKSLPDNIVPIAICAKVPSWYKGLQYKALAPKYEFFMKWKETHNNDYYIECFNEQVLWELDQDEVLVELSRMAGESNPSFEHICLVCYEKPSDFCHRHLVADWFRNAGFSCEEWNS